MGTRVPWKFDRIFREKEFSDDKQKKLAIAGFICCRVAGL